MSDIYKAWAKKSTKAWIQKAVFQIVGKYSDGTWGGLSDGSFFTNTAKPFDLANEIVDVVYEMLWIGEEEGLDE